ncbi:MAG TPA: hypothetical protein VJO53_08675 [Candidatus Acidoferrales bacterium]|nr:hypothetical protein [Candidatus Acidoferrales bacterium]
MSRRGVYLLVPILVALALAMPLAAREAGTKNGKTTSTTLDVLSAVTLAGKQLKPGMYRVTADDSRVTLEQDGKVVAEAPVQWKDETAKPHYSNIVTVGTEVKEIHFSGKMRYVEIGG